MKDDKIHEWIYIIDSVLRESFQRLNGVRFCTQEEEVLKIVLQRKIEFCKILC